jgi:hypothetical protein
LLVNLYFLIWFTSIGRIGLNLHSIVGLFILPYFKSPLPYKILSFTPLASLASLASLAPLTELAALTLETILVNIGYFCTFSDLILSLL